MRRNRELSRRRASTTWPSSQWRRRVKAAKLMRTWKAMRVFSGRTVTGPDRRAAARSRRNHDLGIPTRKVVSELGVAAEVCLVAVGEAAATQRAGPQRLHRGPPYDLGAMTKLGV